MEKTIGKRKIKKAGAPFFNDTPTFFTFIESVCNSRFRGRITLYAISKTRVNYNFFIVC